MVQRKECQASAVFIIQTLWRKMAYILECQLSPGFMLKPRVKLECLFCARGLFAVEMSSWKEQYTLSFWIMENFCKWRDQCNQIEMLHLELLFCLFLYWPRKKWQWGKKKEEWNPMLGACRKEISRHFLLFDKFIPWLCVSNFITNFIPWCGVLILLLIPLRVE